MPTTGNIAFILQKQAVMLPDQIAIIDGKQFSERQTSFAQLEDLSARFAAQLLSYGLKQGDVVLIFQPVSLELYVSLMAIFRLGLVAMFVDPSVGLDHLERCCQRVRPDGLIASSKAHILRFVSRALRRIPVKISTGWCLPFSYCYKKLTKFKPLENIVAVEEKTPALITFTSGSTGLPKAAVRTHGFLLAQHKVLAESIAHQSGQVDVSTLPIFVLANLASGLTSLLCDVDLRYPGRVDAAVVLEQANRFKASRCAASPAFFEQLVSCCNQNESAQLPFSRMDTGGAPVFPGLLARLDQLAPNAEVVAVYGSTEAEPIAHIHWSNITEQDLTGILSGRGLLAGKPVKQIEVRVIRDQTGQSIPELTKSDFAAMTLGTDCVGEIVVAGGHVLPGYLDGIGNEETKFRVNGEPWHRTGDAGYFDQHGRLWLMGRTTAKIKDRHGELYPFTVEAVVRSDPVVRRSAMIEYNAQRYLLVEANPGGRISLDETRDKLGWAKLDHIISVEHIPVDKRHNAKIDYPALRQLLNRMNK